MATTVEPPGSLQQPPPRAAPHETLAQQQQQQQPRQSLSREAPGGGPAGSAAIRALQVLRETQPRPSRRQSLPAGLPPRGLPLPLQLADKRRASIGLGPHPTQNTHPALVGKPPSIGLGPHPTQNTHPALVGKPPPPTTRRPSVLPFDDRRRHSTGNVERPTLLGTVRPPPPRGPPPPAGEAATINNAPSGNVVPLQAARENMRRRSSGLRGPPPGPPPPARRASVPLPIRSPSSPEPPEPWASRLAQPQQHPQQQPWAAAKNTLGGLRETGVPAPRRVSFSTYKGPPTLNGGDCGGFNDNITKLDSGLSGHDGGCETNVVSTTPQPLPNLQRRQSSQRASNSASPGKPPPPRPPRGPMGGPIRGPPGGPPDGPPGGPPGGSQGGPPGGPPRGPPGGPPGVPPGGPPVGEIRRYSISNELSGGFSRRMSAVSALGGSSDATAAESSLAVVAQKNGARGGMPTSTSDGTIDSVPPSIDPGMGMQQQQLPPRRASALPEGRAAVLWYNMGVTKQKERDANGAVECYERAAKEGHAKAQHNLAAIYEKGVPGVVPKNDVEAARLFQQAADQGLAESCYSYAMHLKFGLGIDQDDARCVYYLEQASASGLVKAMFNLGLMYEKHRGVSPDAPEADLLEATRECYQAAAEAGITKAMVNLGVLCMSGRLPGREPGEALEWFKRAADEGDVSGLWNLSLCYERGVGVAQDSVAAQALQQQCRDRESQNQTRRGSSSMIGGAAAAVGSSGPLRRSSETPAFSPAPIGDATVVGASERETSRRRSSSIPAVTPPPPDGSPPAQAKKPDQRQDATSADSKITAAPAAAGGRSRGYKYVPKEETPTDRPPVSSGPPATRRYSSTDSPAESKENEGGAAAPPGASGDSVPLPARERRDSFLLKPTPQAIARVKAAVERRRKQEAAAEAAVGNSSGGK